MGGLSDNSEAVLTFVDDFSDRETVTFPFDGASTDGLKREYNCQPALSAMTMVAAALKAVGVLFQYFNMTLLKRPIVVALKMTVSLRLISFAVIESLLKVLPLMVILGCQPCLKSQLNSEDAECPLFPNYCPLRLDSQEKTDSPPVADFRL
jgi:hypothetical protein